MVRANEDGLRKSGYRCDKPALAIKIHAIGPSLMSDLAARQPCPVVPQRLFSRPPKALAAVESSANPLNIRLNLGGPLLFPSFAPRA